MTARVINVSAENGFWLRVTVENFRSLFEWMLPERGVQSQTPMPAMEVQTVSSRRGQ